MRYSLSGSETFLRGVTMPNELSEADELVAMLTSSPRSVTRNTDQEILVTTRDKVELALRRELPRYVSGGELVSVTSLTLAILTTILTATFNDFIGIEGAAWKGMFSLGLVASGAYNLHVIIRWFRRSEMSQLVDSIASESQIPKA
jgi:hypothetical protein